MTIARVEANNHRRAFDASLSDGRTLSLPYARLDVSPEPDNPVVEVHPDPELGCQGFTYTLRDGTEDTVPLDALLDYNRDPAYMRDLLVYRLTLEAQLRVEATDLSRRELIRRLDTSPSQFYRLLDTTYYGKSIDRMVELLFVLGCDVRMEVVERGA